MNDARRLLGGRYEVGDLIGRGGMADVHLGQDTRLGRQVAIKILRSELARDRSFLMRFRREAQAAASLNHPSIVAVFDSGEESITENSGAQVAVPYIVMEFVPGRTLRDILAEQGPFEPFEAARIMAEVLRALDYSHDNGIIHRDIKPANVILGPHGEPKVMDFGIARAIADTAATMTNTSIVVGTAQYLSPEQAQGLDVDARSDLYSAGCLLYELLTGRAPFIGDSPVAIAYQHVGQPPQPPALHRPDLPASLDVVTLHALAKEPEARYQTGADFAADLDAVRTGGPTIAAREAIAAGTLAPLRSDDDLDRTGATTVVPAAAVAQAAEVPEAPEVRRTETVLATDDPEKKKWPLWAVVAAALSALAVALLLAWNAGLFDGKPDTVSVPAVVQKTQAEATRILTDAGFQVKAEPVRNNARAGTVVGQNPDAQSQQPQGSLVTLSVSSGPGTVTVPDLANYDQPLVGDRLKAVKLTLGDIQQVDSMSVPEGKVVSTEPKAGSKVPEGTAVKLNVSTGKMPVPDVVGMSQRGAIEALGKVGLRADVQMVPSDREAGTVLSQAFPKGTKVRVGDPVTITVAEPRPTPSVVTTTQVVTETPRPGGTERTPSTTPPPGDTTDPTGPADPTGTDSPEPPAVTDPPVPTDTPTP